MFVSAESFVEGFDLTPENLKNAHDVLNGTREADEVLNKIVDKYTSK